MEFLAQGGAHGGCAVAAKSSLAPSCPTLPCFMSWCHPQRASFQVVLGRPHCCFLFQCPQAVL